MIFLDTNYIVRLLVHPTSEDELVMMDHSARLMRAVMADRAQVTTCDAVIAEVVFVLSGPTYRASRQEIASGLSRLLQLPGFRSPQLSTWLRALRMWLDRTPLSFVDALSAAYALADDYELATFDKKLAQYPGLNVYTP